MVLRSLFVPLNSPSRPFRWKRGRGSGRRAAVARSDPAAVGPCPVPARRPPSGGSLKPPRFGEGVLAAGSSGRRASPESSHPAAGTAPFAKFRQNSAEMPARCMAAGPSARSARSAPAGPALPSLGAMGRAEGRLDGPGPGAQRAGAVTGRSRRDQWRVRPKCCQPVGRAVWGAAIRQPEENGKVLGKKIKPCKSLSLSPPAPSGCVGVYPRKIAFKRELHPI